MTDVRRDSWGRWGIIIPLAVMALGSSLFAVIGNLVLGLQTGFGHPMNYIFLALYGGITFVFALVVVWSIRGRRRWLESTGSEQ